MTSPKSPNEAFRDTIAAMVCPHAFAQKVCACGGELPDARAVRCNRCERERGPFEIERDDGELHE